MSITRLVTSPRLLGVLIAGFLGSYLLALFADRRMRAVFSQFWHEVQPQLRQALKHARESAAVEERGFLQPVPQGGIQRDESERREVPAQLSQEKAA
jgi:hypothetical protein